MQNPLKLAIIIVNYNSKHYVLKCLESIRKHLVGLPHEVCVVDNASTDDSVETIKREFPETILVANRANRGFAAGVNQGIRETTAPYVLWLNPDSEVLDSKLKELIEYLEIHSEVGVVGPKILNPDKSIQISCRAFPSYMNYLFGRHSPLTKLFPKNPWSKKFLLQDMNRDEIHEVDWVSGAVFLHRRELIHQVGLLDEGYFMYFEEVDYCQRVKKMGMKVIYHPGATFLHQIAGSSRKVSAKTYIIRQQSNWRYYLKHFKRNRFKDVFIASGLFLKAVSQITISFFQHIRLPKKRTSSGVSA